MFRKIALASIALGLALCTSAAFAASVTFNTQSSGGFTGPDATAGGLTLSATSLAGTSTLSFAGTPGDTTVTGLGNTVSLGMFTLSSTTTFPDTNTFAAGDKFTIFITQTAPAGSGSSTAAVSGTVSSTTGGALLLTFVPNPIIIGDATYTLIPTTVPFPSASNPAGPGVATLQALVDVSDNASNTPVPAAACGGLALMGVLGTRVRRNRAA